MGALLVASRPKVGRQRGWRDGVRDGATGSGTVMGVGDDVRGTASGIEVEGGIGNGVGTMVWH
jgi:hypothetical protein